MWSGIFCRETHSGSERRALTVSSTCHMVETLTSAVSAPCCTCFPSLSAPFVAEFASFPALSGRLAPSSACPAFFAASPAFSVRAFACSPVRSITLLIFGFFLKSSAALLIGLEISGCAPSIFQPMKSRTKSTVSPNICGRRLFFCCFLRIIAPDSFFFIPILTRDALFGKDSLPRFASELY